jgi:uncharacterized protein YigE (DUF2233 family)
MILRLALLLALTPVAANAATCRDTRFDGTSYTLCEVTLEDDLRLFHSGADGVYGSFTKVNAALDAEGNTLGFAMNAGMYHRDLDPVGLYVEDGTETAALVTRDGPGNFGLLPNGVFCWGDRFRIVESRTFKADRPDCRYATQSGPMLVIDGALHPAFAENGDSLHVRNGVGVDGAGIAWFAISDEPVSFGRFARLFKDALGCRNALFLDGAVSSLWDRPAGRRDTYSRLGPLVAIFDRNQETE